jgi:hypothetical protein
VNGPRLVTAAKLGTLIVGILPLATKDDRMSGQEYDSLHSRGKALEDAYFAQRDRELAAKLKSRLDADEMKRLLHYSVGLTDELADKGFAHLTSGLEVVAAMALLPMVEVAWCDGTVSPEEKGAVLRGAAEMGLGDDSPLQQFLQNWLDHRPSPAALEAWKSYVRAFVGMVDPAHAATARQDIIGRAEKVARAAGGFLGFGNKISAAEQACLDELARAFG